MSDPTDRADVPATAVVTLRLRPGVDVEFASWQAKMSTSAAGFRGFINAEVRAPVAEDRSQWSFLAHFRTVDDLRLWRESEQYRRLLRDAESLVNAGDQTALRDEESAEGYVDGAVTEVVTTHVKIGKERVYQDWAERIHRAEAQFPGYRGGFLQPPASEQQPYWTTLVRFATPDQLNVWLNSDARRDLLREHTDLVESWEQHRMPSSFAGWFPENAANGESPAAWKQSMLVVLVLFPVVMLELRFLSPVLAGLNSAVATFIGNVISVALIAWPFMPLVIRRMNWWLSPKKDRLSSVNAAGLVLVLALYAIEITMFARFF